MSTLQSALGKSEVVLVEEISGTEHVGVWYGGAAFSMYREPRRGDDDYPLIEADHWNVTNADGSYLEADEAKEEIERRFKMIEEGEY